MPDPFKVLHVEQGASGGEVRKAYRELARRWHPDRFADGPERMWAEQRMIEINLAYQEALVLISGQQLPAADEMTPEHERLSDAQQLIDLGQLSAARQALMRVSSRDAEWYYLFGAVLLRLGEYEKALLYFGIATRQNPNNSRYRVAFLSAEAIRGQRRAPNPLQKIKQTLTPRKR